MTARASGRRHLGHEGTPLAYFVPNPNRYPTVSPSLAERGIPCRVRVVNVAEGVDQVAWSVVRQLTAALTSSHLRAAYGDWRDSQTTGLRMLRATRFPRKPLTNASLPK